MTKEDDNTVTRPDDVGGFEVPAPGGDPDTRMRLLKHARAASDSVGDDVSEWDDEITDERNRAGRGPEQDEEAREEMERVEEQRRAEAAERRKTAAETGASTSDSQERAKTEPPKGRTTTPTRATTAPTTGKDK